MAKKKPAPASKSKAARKHSTLFMMGKENYILMIAGLVLLAIGYALMAGGGTDDPSVFNEKEIYSPRRITVSVIVVMIGFAMQIVAIMKRPKSEEG